MFRIAFHTAFVEAGILVLNLPDLDDVSKNVGKFLPNFQVNLMISLLFSRTHSLF